MAKPTNGVPRHLQWAGRLMFLVSVLTCFFIFSDAQTADPILERGRPAKPDVRLELLGGGGGNPFNARCPQGQLLKGFEMRAGDDVDAIRPVCVTADGPAHVRPIIFFPYGNNMFGGPGGSSLDLICPKDTPIVIGMEVSWEGLEIETVNGIELWCGIAGPEQNLTEAPTLRFAGPVAQPKKPLLGGRPLHIPYADQQFCPAGLVAVGINGRSGKWLDAVGLICGFPTLARPAPEPEPVKAIGRTKVPPAVDTTPLSICEAARQARARNSPAAPGLEAQCLAAGPAGEEAPVKAIGRTKLPVTDPPTLPSTATPVRPICDVAREARERNSPAALGLEEKCVNDLALRGEAIAIQDPLAAELRNREAEGPSRRGFDIGMAAAEGQTAPGAGKQRIHDSLKPAEQSGFRTAVAFSLERNRNADLAARGAAIARVDRVVNDARYSDADVFFWLGFDIASGIFGDPVRGAQGSTTITPASQTIRDSLSAAGQRGFDASMRLHLRRNYRRR